MSNLFEKYKDDPQRALIVARNALMKTASFEDFQTYADYICNHCIKDIFSTVPITEAALDTAAYYFELLEEGTAYYADRGELDEDGLELIMGIREAMKRLNKEMTAYSEELRKTAVKKAADKCCAKILEAKDAVKRLSAAKTRAEFNAELENIKKIDGEINPEILNENQKKAYDLVSKNCSEVVAKKLKAFDRAEGIRYNIQAVRAYEAAFNIYASGKTEVDDPVKVIDEFFSFEPSKLFNETVVYYNHVYNYIMNQLSEEEKVGFTIKAIQTDKK